MVGRDERVILAISGCKYLGGVEKEKDRNNNLITVSTVLGIMERGG